MRTAQNIHLKLALKTKQNAPGWELQMVAAEAKPLVEKQDQ
jgi:hypothetical protein